MLGELFWLLGFIGVCKGVDTLLFWECLTEVIFWGAGGLRVLGIVGVFVIFVGLGLFWGVGFF